MWNIHGYQKLNQKIQHGNLDSISLSKFWLHGVLHISKELPWLLTYLEANIRSETLCNRKQIKFWPLFGLKPISWKFYFYYFKLWSFSTSSTNSPDFAWFPASAWVYMRSSLFWNVTTNQCCITSQNNKDLSPDFVQLLTFWVYLNIFIKEEKDNHVTTQVTKWKTSPNIKQNHEHSSLKMKHKVP